MTKLLKKHPFIIFARELERLEARVGITDDLMEKRIRLQRRFPKYFAEYMEAKKTKQTERAYREKMEKEIQLRERRGFETVSYLKNKIAEQKRKNRLKAELILSK